MERKFVETRLWKKGLQVWRYINQRRKKKYEADKVVKSTASLL